YSSRKLRRSVRRQWRVSQGLPARVAHIRQQHASRPKKLQSRDAQVRSVEPDLPINFRRPPAAQLRQYVVPRGFVIKLFQQNRFFLANLLQQQRLQEVLRPQILQRLFTDPLQRHFTDQEFVFRRQPHPEFAAVTGHIENRFPDHRRLAHHPHVRRPRRQQERF